MFLTRDFSPKATKVLSLAASLSLLGMLLPAAAAQISFDTGVRDSGLSLGSVDPDFKWNYTGSFTDSLFDTYVTSDGLTWIMPDLTMSLNDAYGPDVSVGTPPFNGVGFVYYSFNLPLNVENVRVNLDRMFVDDRVTVSVNDVEVGTYQFTLPDDTPTSGVMYDQNLKAIPKTFSGRGTSGLAFDDQSLFKPGETNVIRFWFNNTFSSDPNAPAIPLQGGPDRDWLDLQGSVNYEVSETVDIPEPAGTAGLLAFLSAATTFFGRKKAA